MRTPVVAGNWKMHHGPKAARRLALEIRNGRLGARDGVEVVLCPPFPSLAAVHEIVREAGLGLGGQNCHWEAQGAFTGEVAAPMLREAGCDWVIVGHSERRTLFGDTDALVARRARAALDAGLRVIACVGETLAERDAGRTREVVERQLRDGLGGFTAADLARMVVAYEPVWAIGTGRNATPEQAQEVHALVRGEIAARAGRAAADSLRILYGGSVKPDNAAALLASPEIDGALVGGASLESASFLRIVAAAAGS